MQSRRRHRSGERAELAPPSPTRAGMLLAVWEVSVQRRARVGGAVDVAVRPLFRPGGLLTPF